MIKTLLCLLAVAFVTTASGATTHLPAYIRDAHIKVKIEQWVNNAWKESTLETYDMWYPSTVLWWERLSNIQNLDQNFSTVDAYGELILMQRVAPLSDGTIVNYFDSYNRKQYPVYGIYTSGSLSRGTPTLDESYVGVQGFGLNSGYIGNRVIISGNYRYTYSWTLTYTCKNQGSYPQTWAFTHASPTNINNQYVVYITVQPGQTSTYTPQYNGSEGWMYNLGVSGPQ